MKGKALSIEQMKVLHDLGLETSDASMHWQYLPTSDAIINRTDELEEEPCLFISQPKMKYEYPAYTLQDILDHLPTSINWKPLIIVGNSIMYSAGYGEGYNEPMKIFEEESLLESAYRMLCWVVEQNELLSIHPGKL